MCLAGLAVLFLLSLSVGREIQASETSFKEVLKQSIALDFGENMLSKLVPVFAFSQQEEQGKNWLIEQQITQMLPLYGYSRAIQDKELEQQKYLSMEDIAAEEEGGNRELVSLEGEEDATMQELLKAENEAAADKLAEETTPESVAEEKKTENVTIGSAFIPHEKQVTVDLQTLSNYEALVNTFYTIDGNTMAGSDQLDAAKLSGKDLTISKESEGPQILIYHTHSQEGFADSVPGDANTTIVGVGAYLSEILQTRYGYQVLHHTGQYDVETRDDAYSNSLPAIEQVLAENPSIEVIIDLHRDSMPEETKLVMDLDGRPTARFMFFNGLSRTKNTGDIAYLYNENQEDNLAFSFQMQLKAMEYYPGLTRKIYLKGYRYNMHLRPRTTLIELGAQNNTVEEAMNACDPLAHIIDMVLSGQ